MFPADEMKKTDCVISSFSSSPIFRSAVVEYASQLGLSFSEAVRHLIANGLKANNLEEITMLSQIQSEVRRQYRKENVAAYQASDNEVPDNPHIAARKRIENDKAPLTGTARLSKRTARAQADDDNLWSREDEEETETERFERIYSS